jgi:hypothetical protein
LLNPRTQIPRLKFQESNSRNQIPGIKFQESNPRNQNPSLKFKGRVKKLRIMEFGSWALEFGI